MSQQSNQLPVDGRMRDEGATAGQILRSVAAEVERVHGLVEEIERTVCKLSERQSLRAAERADLQKLDIVLQSLVAIKEFSAATAVASELDGMLDIEPALKLIRLAEVRARLSGSINDTDKMDEAEFF